VRPAMLFGNFQKINIYVAKCFGKRCREIIESNLSDTQCGFRHGRSSTDHTSLTSKILSNLRNMLKISEYAKDITCFVHLEKAYNRVPCEKL